MKGSTRSANGFQPQILSFGSIFLTLLFLSPLASSAQSPAFAKSLQSFWHSQQSYIGKAYKIDPAAGGNVFVNNTISNAIPEEKNKTESEASILGCDLTTYQTAYLIGPDEFPFTSGTGITVNATTNVGTLDNQGYICNGNVFNTASTAWWINTTDHFITLNFSAPVTAFSVVVNGSNNTEIFTFTAATGSVNLNNFCTAAFALAGAGNQLQCTASGTNGTLVTINNPTGSTQYTITHNGLAAGSRISLIDCFVQPNAVCRPYTASLGTNGSVTITAANVDNGSSAPNGIASMTVSPSTLNCANIGANTVVLTVTDVNGLISTCSSTVTVQDNTNPTARCENFFSVNLNSGGSASVTGADVDNGSTDNCGISNLAVSPSSFGCANIGFNTVVLTVTDNNGRTSTCTAIVVVNSVNPTAANAGPDAAVCSLTTNLAGNTPSNGTAGTWTKVSGPGTVNFVDANSATTSVTVTVAGVYTLRWTIANACTAGRFDDVIITFAANPTTANAGPNQTVCGTSATLAANTPSIGTGAWSIIGGAGGSVTTLSSPTSGFTGVAGTAYTLRWTVSNAPCTASTDDVVITLRENPTLANAGPNQAVCGTSVTLAANTPSIGTGTWSIVGGAGGNVATPSSPTSGFTGVAGTIYTLHWTVSNAPCPASTDDVVINLTANPTTANAGPDQTSTPDCDLSLLRLAGNAPTIGTGMWSIQSGTGGSFGDASNRNSNFYGVEGNIYTLRWTVTNGACPASTDEMMVTFPQIASAGPDQTVCFSPGTATMAGTLPNGGSGIWTKVNGPAGGNITTPTSPTTTVTGLANVGTYLFQWEVTPPACTTSLFYQMQIMVQDCCPPTGTVWYVDAAAAPGGTGSAWDCAFQNVQDAIDAAGSGHEIWVKAGTYKPTAYPSGCTGCATDRDKTFHLKDAVAVYGGFAGTETARSQRNWANNVTVLSGDIGTPNNNSDNCYHVVLSVNDGSATVLDGFTVTRGNANGSTGSTIMVETRTISRAIGAGMDNFFFNGNISNCIFSNNTANNSGAGMANALNASSMSNCLFSGNSAITAGGGMYNTSCSIALTNCTFSGNYASAGGAIGNNGSQGAGIALTNCLLWNNRANIANTPQAVSIYNLNTTLVTIAYSLVQYQTPSGTGNLDGIVNAADPNYPAFVTPLDPSTAPSTAGDFHLTACSPVLNLGDNTGAPATDLFGNNRIFGGTIDLGVHELQAARTPAVALCQNTTVQLDGAGNATLTASALDNGSTGCAPLSFSASKTNFTCADLGANTVPLTVTALNGATATCNATVTVVDQVAPNALCRDIVKNLGANGTVTVAKEEVNNLSNDNCGTVNLVSVTPSSFGCANIGMNTVTLTVNDGRGNTSSCNATVTIADNTAPTAVCQNLSVNLNGSGMATVTAAQIDNGSSDNCGIASLSVLPNSFACANVGPQTVTLTVTDVNSLTATCAATVTVSDATNPTALCQNVSVNLNGSGTATVAASQVNNGSSDNCGIASLALSTTSFTCSNVGANPVTLTVTDNNGRTATCAATVTVSDNANPTALCQNVTVNLDGNGNASLSAAQVDGGSSDNCGIATLLVTPNAFTASNIGPNTVTLTVTDNNGRTASCTATVTVTNTNLPNAACQPYTVSLNGGGMATIAAANVDGGSSAVGGIQSLGVLPNSFNCTNLGANPVTLTVTGNNGLTATCSTTVTVQDNTPPTVVCQNITVNLSGNSANITAAQVLNTGASTDNCGTVAAQSVSTSGFTCSNLGPNAVTLTANDSHGNTATCTATVTVNDNTPPTALCQNITVNLGAGGMASVSAAQVNNASTDNCGTVNLVGVSPSSSFACANIGPNTVTLTVNDGHGNTATCAATVTVRDNTAPTALCRDVVLQLDANGNAALTAAQVNNGSSDNCALGTLTVSPNAFTLANLGLNTVTLTVPDANGNSASCTAQVTVENNQLPNAVCQNITRSLGTNGQVAISAADIDGGSTALGGIANRVASPNLLNCSNIGANTVTLTITGNNGRQASCNATVTVNDATAPTALCQNAAVNLDAGGNATVAAAQINNNSTDNCGTVNPAVSPNSFACANLGANTVTLTVNDGHGNTATCNAVVTVSDNTAPGIVCPANQTVTGNSACQGTMGSYAALATKSDNCTAPGSINVVQSPVSGGLFSGSQTVTLTATDGSNNTATCAFTVSVVDNTAPTIVCPANQTVSADATCQGTVGNYVALATKSDNCTAPGSINVVQSPISGTPIAGTTTVTLTATDAANNSANCIFSVSIRDVTPPTVGCPANQTVTGNATCQGTMGSYVALATKSDNCSAPSSINVTQSPASGGLFTGSQTVTLTATDAANNSATCAFTVSVVDNTAPTIVCPANQTVSANATCQGTVGNYVALATKSDNCSAPGGINVAQSPISGTNISGTTTVTLTATDAANNSATCVFSVSIRDVTPPTVGCPANQTVTANANCQGTLGSYAALATKSDNCSAPSNISVSQSPASGGLFTGSQTVTLTASDFSENTATCSFVVTVVDNIAPSITCPANQTVSANASCQGTLGNYVALATKSDNCTAPNSIGVTQGPLSGTTISATTTVVLTATDASTNSAYCSFSVSIRDVTPPTVACPTNQTVSATTNVPCTAVVNGINATFNDLCSSVSLAYALTGTTMGSGSGQASGTTFQAGSTTVTYTATDGAGLSATCALTVYVNPCQVTFTGTITWKQDNTTGVKDATVAVTGDRVGSATTATNGTYSLTLDPGSNFVLTPSKNLNKLNGVNAQDVQRIQQHLSGGLITNPWQLVAADVNGNNLISALDANILQLALLGNPSALDQMPKSWRFVPKTHTMGTPPWGFPENIVLTGAAGTVNNLDFWGFKVGDLVSTYANPANSTGQSLVLTAQDESLTAGQTLTVDVTAAALRDLTALQLALRFDPEYLQLSDVQALDGLPLTKENFGTYQSAEGSVRVVWSGAQSAALRAGAPLFRLQFVVLEGGPSLSGVLRLDDETLLGQVFNSDGAASGVSLRFEGVTAVQTPVFDSPRPQLLQNQPNPFTRQTTIGFVLPEACEAQLRIVEAGGRVVAERRKQYPAGRHTEVFDLNVVPGVLYYELTTPFGVLVRKMVVVE